MRKLWPLSLHLLVFAFALAMIFPFLWMVSTSLKSDSEVFAYPPKLIPWPPVWENYREAWQIANFGRYFFNSAFVALMVTGIGLFLNSLAAYAFSRLRFRGRDVLFMLLLATMMIPAEISMIPTFMIFKQIGWIDTFLPLIVPAWFASPFFAFLYRQFFMGIPLEMDEAAKVDGAGPMRVFWHVLLPMAKPVTVTVAVFTFFGAWNAFLGPLIYINSDHKRRLEKPSPRSSIAT